MTARTTVCPRVVGSSGNGREMLLCGTPLPCGQHGRKPERQIAPLVYVAGPITGDPFGCVGQAADAFEVLRLAGCVPFLPQLSVIHEMVRHRSYDAWLAYDRDVIRHCDALVRLPGDSPGADEEVAFARELRIPVFEFADIEHIWRWVNNLREAS